MFQTLRRFTALTVAAGLLALVGVESSDAASLGGATRNLKKAPAAQFIAERHPTLAPFSHVLFCKENPGECSGRGSRDVVVTITADKADELERVNRQVNRAIRPRHDRAGVLGDRWSLAPQDGDCEDYALTKRHRLVALGWPASALRLAVVTTRQGEGHAVLVVKTSAGDLVLDNRTGLIKPWRDTGLRWVKIQSSENPRMWFSL